MCHKGFEWYGIIRLSVGKIYIRAGCGQPHPQSSICEVRQDCQKLKTKFEYKMSFETNLVTETLLKIKNKDVLVFQPK